LKIIVAFFRVFRIFRLSHETSGTDTMKLTQSEKTTAWNHYGDWKMENLLDIALKCNGLAKLAIDYVISKRKKIA